MGKKVFLFVFVFFVISWCFFVNDVKETYAVSLGDSCTASQFGDTKGCCTCNKYGIASAATIGEYEDNGTCNSGPTKNTCQSNCTCAPGSCNTGELKCYCGCIKWDGTKTCNELCGGAGVGGGDGGGGLNCTTPSSGKILKFDRNGEIGVFVEGLDGGTVSFSGSQTVSITVSGEGLQSPTFKVKAGDTLTISTKNPNEAKNGYGWIPPRAGNKCGPSKGAACGVAGTITDFIERAKEKGEVIGITAGATPANIQCWADALVGDQAQDYDFNDWRLILIYKNPDPGACMEVGMKKFTKGVLGNLLTADEMNKLQKGDKLRLVMTANRERLRGRFQIKIDGVIVKSADGDWWPGKLDTDKKTIYLDYQTKKPGKYEFLGEVTTMP